MNAEEPLLTGAHSHEQYNSLGHKSSSQKPDFDITPKSELRFVLRSSGPLVITFFLQYLLSVTTIFSAGKLGLRELAAASLAVCTFNITGLAVYQGMATSLDSFCSQAYGSGKLHNVGLYFQRCSMMMMALTLFPLVFIWWYSGTLLQYLVPDPELAHLTQTYLRINAIGAPGLILFETSKRFLQAQHCFNAGTWVLLIATPLNFVLNWILVWHPTYGLGFSGAPLAVSIIYWFISFMMLAYVLFVDGKKCWGGLQLYKACKNWSPMLKLALPGVIMVEAEYLAFEVLTIFAASFGTNALAAQSIASNAGSLAFQLPFAVAVAISTRIGHFVGMKHIYAAKLVTRITVVLSAYIAAINFSLVFFGRHILGKLFTSSQDVLKISDKILILVAINQIADSFNVLGAGILRGQGRQSIGSILNMISYYVIALPIGYGLAFKLEYGLFGLWTGLILGVLFLAITEFICMCRSDWPRILEESYGRHDN